MEKNMKLSGQLVTVIVLFASSFIFSVSAENEGGLIRFGVVADVQYCDCETRGSRFYRNSLSKLEACVADLNHENVEFTVALGDLSDRETDLHLPAVLQVLASLNQPVYHTTGNHDYGGVTDNEVLYRQLGMPSSYYSFTRKGWRFILLNTNEISTYANITGTPKEAEMQVMWKRIEESKRTNRETYNGGISREQMDWLKEELDTAERNHEAVLLFSHHPLYAAPGLTALNDLEILELISGYSCVKGAISGHHHPGDYGEYKGIPFITTEGMIETESENAYGIVDIYKDWFQFTGKGRSRSYTIPLSE